MLGLRSVSKTLDQTVREIKREVNKSILKVPLPEQKTLDATSNEPWGPHGQTMSDIAQMSFNSSAQVMIMGTLLKRLTDQGKNWRHVYKALIVMEYLVANGSERIVDEMRERAYQIQGLVDFQYIDPDGKDEGTNVRKKAQAVAALLKDKNRIMEMRLKAKNSKSRSRGGVQGIGSNASPYESPDKYTYSDANREGGGGSGAGAVHGGYGYGGYAYEDKERREAWEEYNGGDSSHSGSGSRQERYVEEQSPRSRRSLELGGGPGGGGGASDAPGRQTWPTTSSHSPEERTERENGGGGFNAGYGSSEQQGIAKPLSPFPPPAAGAAKTGGGADGAAATAAKSNLFISPSQAPAFGEGAGGGSAGDAAFDEFDPRASFQASLSNPNNANSGGQWNSPAPAASSQFSQFPGDGFSASTSTSSAAGDFPSNPFGNPQFSAAPPPVYSPNPPLSPTPLSSVPFNSLPQPSAPSAFPQGNAQAFTSPPPGALGFPPVNNTGNTPGLIGSRNGGIAMAATARDAPAFTATAAGGPPLFASPSTASVGVGGPSMMSAKTNSSPASASKSPAAAVEVKQGSVWADALTAGLIDLNITTINDPLKDLGIVPEKKLKQVLRQKEEAKSASRVSAPPSMGRAMGTGSGLGLSPQPPMGMGMGMGAGRGMGMGMEVGGMGPGMGAGVGMGIGGGAYGSQPSGGMPPGGYSPMGGTMYRGGMGGY